MSTQTNNNWSSILIDRYTGWLVTGSGGRDIPKLFAVLFFGSGILLLAAWAGLAAYQVQRHGALANNCFQLHSNCFQLHSKDGSVISIPVHLFAAIDAGVIIVSLLLLLSCVACWSACIERFNKN